MAKIQVLDENTINKIAAGEVIENPASVVKEIVENSLDAGSKSITVEIVAGGRELIRISDDGCGMSPDDALLALERHATSKIRTVEEILSLSTMGFRGEALPSIASISKCTLLTSDGKKATLTQIEGGKILRSVPAERSRGTTIEIRSLFYNVPVRRKFQRSPTYDASEILKRLSIIALANPDVHFELIHNEKRQLQVGEEERIGAILGKDFMTESDPVLHEEGPYKIEGRTGKPTKTRHNRSGQYLFINERPIFSPFISDIVKEGYGTALSEGRYPVFVLYLTIPGDIVDVNVHPQKKTVRFRQDDTLRRILLKAFYKSAAPPPTATFQLSAPSFKSTYTPPVKPVESAPVWTPPPLVPQVLGTISGYVLLEGATLPNEEFPDKTGLFLLDQHAASERILFERMEEEKRAYGRGIQPLLIPITIEVSSIEAALLRDHLAEMQKMGIEVEEFGKSTFIIKAVPTLLQKADMEDLLLQILERLRELGGDALEEEKKKEMAKIASRGALEHKKRLTREEALALLEELLRCESPYRSPFGKPTIANITPETITKCFR